MVARLSMPMILQVAWQKKQMPTVIAPTMSMTFYGRVTKRTLPNEAAYTYAYDALGRLTKQTGPQGLSKTYSYDVSGNLVKETDQSDRSNHYSYDKVGRLLTAKNAGSVSGLTKDRQTVASTSYNLYGARKIGIDTTGNPFAYNGEDLDDTGLNYSG